MKPSIILALVCTAALAMSTAGFAADPPAPSDTKPADAKPSDTKPADAKAETKTPLAPAEVRGEVLKIDGDNYFVNDERSKKEVKFTIEKDVKATLERPLKQGDRIEAFLTPEGLAKKVRLEGAKDQDMNKAAKDIGETPPSGAPKEVPAGEKSSKPDQGGMKPPAEGSNPTLSPSGKGSASGG